MESEIATHYAGHGDLVGELNGALAAAGLDTDRLAASDLAALDEFHIRGRQATIELGARMELAPGKRVLDLGSGLGGPARTLAEDFDCHVTGIDLTPGFCAAATALSASRGLSGKTRFVEGDATALPFDAASFDAAMTMHASMNIPNKAAVYEGVQRVLKPGRIFAIYDVVQGEGGDVIFPVPWARDPAISHLATPADMRRFLTDAGFRIEDEIDSSEADQAWFVEISRRWGSADRPPVTFQAFLGDDFPEMTRNQVRNLAEHRIRTAIYICRS